VTRSRFGLRAGASCLSGCPGVYREAAQGLAPVHVTRTRPLAIREVTNRISGPTAWRLDPKFGLQTGMLGHGNPASAFGVVLAGFRRPGSTILLRSKTLRTATLAATGFVYSPDLTRLTSLGSREPLLAHRAACSSYGIADARLEQPRWLEDTSPTTPTAPVERLHGSLTRRVP
jgi:hypothetical protein